MYKVTILPSEKEILADPNESILDAALRSGLNMAYSCNNGSCGECKALIIAGDVEQISHHDYRLTQAEKLNNTVLLCSCAAKSDCAIEAGEAKHAADIAHQRVRAKVSKIERPHAEFVVLQLRTPRTKTLRFLAGQYVRLSVDGIAPLEASVASCPCNGMIMEFHLYRDAGHPFVDYVFDEMKPGEQIRIEGPYGEFNLDEESKRAIVMVGVDIGFAPLKSLIEHAIALDLEQAIQLYWVVTREGMHYRENYCRSWEDALDTFIYKPLVLDYSSNLQESVATIVNEIIASSPIESEIDLYLSGDPHVLRVLKQAFIARGTPQEHVFCEQKSELI